MVRLLFLDRDGTLNRTFGARPPNTPAEVELLPGTRRVLQAHVTLGWRLVIVTNQGGVAAGYLTQEQAYAIQRRVVEKLALPVAASYLCPHMRDAAVADYALDCPNRKPKPGFLLTALDTFGALAADCLFVGDSSTDRDAACAAGVPFCWADRFFGRPIDRGVVVGDGKWVQVRQVPAQEADKKRLVALHKGEVIGCLNVGGASGACPDLKIANGWEQTAVGRLLIEIGGECE